jgi:antitoxin ChpS
LFNFWEIHMLKTSLRKVGGSVMLAVPPAVLDLMHLEPGAMVGMNVEDGKLVIEPLERPSYSLTELLAQCDFSKPVSTAEQDWLDAAPVGLEGI